MTRDYAKKRARPQANSAPKSQVPGWVWLFTGSVLGAFAMFLVYLAGIPPQPSQLSEALNEAVTTAKSDSSDEEENTPRPRFDFYQLLKESEVTVKAEPPPAPRPSGPGSAPKAEEKVEYVLQVGSFKRPEDADRLRAQLILLNLDARVETVKVRNAETWHRVLVGPFSNQASVTRARVTLANNEIESLLLKRNAGG